MIRLPCLLLQYPRPVARHPGYLLVAMLVFAYGAIAVASLQAETQSPAPRRLLESAKRFEAQQQYPEAIAAYRRYLLLKPEDDAARSTFAKVLSWQGQYVEAVSEYRDILKRHPIDLEIRTALARVLSWQKQFDDARQIYEAVLHEDPTQVDARSGLADVLFWTGRGREALPYYEQVFASRHDAETGNRIDAIKAELSSSSARPSQPTGGVIGAGERQVQSNTGASNRLTEAHRLESEKRYAEAIGAYRDYLIQRPEDDDARAALARLLAWNEHQAEAVVLYRDILVRHPTDLDIRLALALTLSWQKHFEEARQIYEHILQENPANREANKGLADIMFWQGERLNALMRYELLYAEHPDPEIGRQIKAVKEELNASPRAPVGQSVTNLSLPYRNYAKIGYGHYSYTKGIPDERNVLVEAGTSFGDKTLIARIEALNRFGFHDTPVSAEFYSQLWGRAWGYIGAQATANPSFAPNYSAVTEVVQGLGVVHSALSAAEVSFGYRHLLFKKDNIDLFLPGLTVYFPYNVWLTEKLYYVPDTGAMTLASQLTWRPRDRLQFFASGAFGTSGERIVATQDFTRVQSRIIQGGVTFPLTHRLSAEAAGYYEDRGILYVRRGGLINLIVHW
jgi:YaiO family outer membrane protein